ncbi:MAG: MGH1-like glycoside hydrolase domain-containing protein, partial [Chloroflexota bacterium]
MGMFSLNMMSIAIELAREDHVYEDMAIKFFDHFMYIAGALNDLGGSGVNIWDDEDGFYYDVLMLPDGSVQPLKIRSLVGLIPLLAVETLEPELRHALPEFDRRMRWFLHNRQDLASLVPSWDEPGAGKRRLVSLVHGDKIKALLNRALDPDRFLSDHGIRSISKYHEQHPFEFNVSGDLYRVEYDPAESRSGLFGGNSNWRGPVWFPINYLIVQTLRRYHTYYGDGFQVECPVGSGRMMHLDQVADEIARRLISTFLPDESEKRPVYGDRELLRRDPEWRNYVLFYEYFHGDTGKGLGASHQTGWTALVAELLDQFAARGVSSARELSVSAGR